MLKNRILIASILIPPLAYIVFFGELSIFIALILCNVIMMKEFYDMVQDDAGSCEKYLSISMGVLVSFGTYLRLYRYPNLVSATLTFTLIATVVKNVLKSNIEGALRRASTSVFSILYIPFLFSHTWIIKASNFGQIELLGYMVEKSSLWLALVFIISFGSDSAGFFYGRAFGKRLLVPRISPKKTVEGFKGTVVFSIILGLIIYKYTDLGLLNSLSLTIFGSLLAQLGDLGMSIFKRSFNVKDSSALLQSHGGLLDRLDSTLFVAPFVYYFMVLIN